MILLVQYMAELAIITIIQQWRNQHKEYNDDNNDTLAKDNNKAMTPFSYPIAIPVEGINQYKNQNTS